MEIDLESETASLRRPAKKPGQSPRQIYTMASHSERNGTSASVAPPTALLEAFFPGFVPLRSIVQYMPIDTSPYIAASLATGFIAMALRYIIEVVWAQVETFFMCVANIPVNDETYNMVMAWTTTQEFARSSRRFVVNTNLTSRNWHIWQPSSHGGDSNSDEDGDDAPSVQGGHINHNKLQYTPSFGTHCFWHRGRLFFFTRKQVLQHSSVPLSEREEISISTFGRDPSVLRELLEECRANS
jgi:mitochondrial chaperone BCS1